MRSRVYYFPQGHAEHAHGGGAAELASAAGPRGLPPLVLCCVAGVRFLADPETDEVFAKIQPLRLRRQRPAAAHLSSSPAAAAPVGDEAGGGQLRAAMARARVAGAEPGRREARLRAAQACARLDPPPPCRAPVGEGGGGRDGGAAGHGREGLGP